MATMQVSNRLTTAPPPVSGVRMYLQTLSYSTSERLQLFNITRDINEVIRKQGVKSGLALTQTLHTTSAIFINEFQEALLADMKSMLEKVIGRFDYWRHNDPQHSDCDRHNADAHLRAMMLGHTLSLPVRNGALALGYWQSVIFAELDGPRERMIQVQILGMPEDATE
jgi:secondary thiamine-phosphate synthase enzyme